MLIKIKNFQALKDVEIDVRGLTFVVGDTNEGKSAVVRAVEAAMFNRTGTDFINFEAGSCQVDLDMQSDGVYGAVNLSWVKSKKSGSSYVINGVDYEKLGRSFPQILTDNGIKEIEVAKSKHRLIFWRQMDQPFLVKETPSIIFEFLSRMLEERKLIPVIKNVGDDIKVKREEFTKLSGAVESDISRVKIYTEEKQLYESVLLGCPDVEVMNKDFSLLVELVNIEKRLFELDGAIESLDRSGLALNECKKNIDVLFEGIERDLKEICDISSIFEKVEVIDSYLESINSQLMGYEGVLGIDIGSFDVQAYRDLIRIFESLSGIETGIGVLDSRLGLLSGFSGFVFNFEVEAFSALLELQRKFNEVDGSLSMLGVKEIDLLRKLSVCDGELQAFKERSKVCPLCERAF